MKIQEWHLLNEMGEHFHLQGLYDDGEGFRLLLKSDNTEKKLSLYFDSVLSYRKIDEGDLLRSYQKIKEGFHRMECSPYLSWFHEESYDSWKSKNVVHYAVYTINDCVDILSIHSPRIEFG